MSQPDPAPRFPPLLHGVAVPAGADPFAASIAEARVEPEPGRIHFSRDGGTLRAALCLVPDRPLAQALPGALFSVALGLNDALGALIPPEVAVHFDWPGGVKVNGAACGRLRAAASGPDPAAEPDWLVLGVDLPVLPLDAADPGHAPDRTTLWDEGCGDLSVPELIEAWARHLLVWLNRFLDDGLAPLSEGWRHRCDTLGKMVTQPAPGIFMGLDDNGGMVLRQGDRARAIPLCTMLEGQG